MKDIVEYVFMFLIGFLSCVALFYVTGSVEQPFGMSYSGNTNAPSDYIKEDDIYLFEDKIIINLDNAKISRYADTGSMKPVLDENSNGIKIKPVSEDDIEVGDIISYRSGFDLIVHRVVEKDIDNQGVYFITKGDNSDIADGKIRFSDIEYKTIGVLW